MRRSTMLAALLAVWTAATLQLHADDHHLAVATFRSDVTPPIGTPLCDGLVQPAAEIVDPLFARGVVLLSDEQPVVLCSVDWVGIGNAGQDAWREALAEAAGTTPDRVAVHAIHNHDAPGCDFAAAELLAEHGLGGRMFDPEFAREAIRRTAEAVAESLKSPRRVTHVGLGTGTVERVASNRRILGPDGKVQYVRYSSCRIPEAVAAPEGVIDPQVQLVGLWDGERPLVSITHYATHPQSYYGRGGVSADFVGMARELREMELPGVFHVHFNGAGGNVAAGKYNDGSPENRPALARRLAEGMKAAWESVEKSPVRASDVRWTFRPVTLPPRDILVESTLLATLKNEQAQPALRIRAARDLVFKRRMESGEKININCLRLGPARIVYMPGELFVEYQLQARQLLPDGFVAMAAYGDYGPGYIGTKIAYTQGGYETGPVSRTAPEVEEVLMQAVRELLLDDAEQHSRHRPK